MRQHRNSWWLRRVSASGYNGVLLSPVSRVRSQVPPLTTQPNMRIKHNAAQVRGSAHVRCLCCHSLRCRPQPHLLLLRCLPPHQVAGAASSLRHDNIVTITQAPELIVHSSWTEGSGVSESDVIKRWLPRNSAVVVGSGLGRDASSLAAASHALMAGKLRDFRCRVNISMVLWSKNYTFFVTSNK